MRGGVPSAPDTPLPWVVLPWLPGSQGSTGVPITQRSVGAAGRDGGKRARHGSLDANAGADSRARASEGRQSCLQGPLPSAGLTRYEAARRCGGWYPAAIPHAYLAALASTRAQVPRRAAAAAQPRRLACVPIPSPSRPWVVALHGWLQDAAMTSLGQEPQHPPPSRG